MQSDLLTLAETAAYLRVSTWTVRRRIAEGDLIAKKVDGGLHVTADSLQNYVDRHTIPATEPRRSRP